MNPQEQRADLRGERHGRSDSETEREDLQDRGADSGHEDDREEFVAEFGPGGEVNSPVASATRAREMSMSYAAKEESRIGELTDRNTQPAFMNTLRSTATPYVSTQKHSPS